MSFMCAAALPTRAGQPAETKPGAGKTSPPVVPAKKLAASPSEPEDGAKPQEEPAPPAAVALSATDVQPAKANDELTVLLNATLGDLFVAALLKDPEHLRRLQAQLAPAQMPATDAKPPQVPVAPAPEAAVIPGPAAGAN